MSGKKAVITGASYGIGAEFARIFAREGYDLVLTARSADKLEDLAAELEQKNGIRVTCLACDLTEPGTAEKIHAAAPDADVLVNNAGCGLHGRFAEMDRSALLGMVNLNILALTDLTHLYLQNMLARGSGKILNLASTAAFQPGPYMAAYYASKAYVLHLSEALSRELKGTGITVTALCPGPTHSEFQKRAGMADMKLFTATSMAARPVAELGYRAMQAGRTLVIAGWFNGFLAFMTRLSPRILLTWIMERLQGGRFAGRKQA